MMATQRERSNVRWIAWTLIVLPPLAIFAPVLLQDRSFAFRDTAVFYYPLFEWIEQQWDRGELPLWNPHVNYGTPVIGEASSSVFYPGKAIFWLPLEFSWQFKLYVVGHVFLAAAGMYWAARRFGSSNEAAALAAISYACGGGVLFQYCNVVFLVGAAWLPWAIAAVETMLTEFSVRAALTLGVVLALMVLGGDPQMAYHAGLAAAAYAVGRCIFGRAKLLPSHSLPGPKIDDDARIGESPAFSRFTQFVGLLIFAALIAFMLAAIQILPAAEAASLSDRAVYEKPRNIYEAAQVFEANDDALSLAASGLFGEPEPETHAASIYQFSFAPWQMAEYIWPNFSGRYFPQYRRWLNAWPDEPRMWNQSVYLGLLPLLLGLASLRFRSGTIRERWLSWCVVLAVLGSFGEFGLCWALRQPLHLLGFGHLANGLPANPVGGVYWFFVTFLPGYANFRFPAKLLTFAACPFCLLAAQGFDRLCSAREVKTTRLYLLMLASALLSGVLALKTWVNAGWFEQLTGAIAPDEAYGPFDSAGAKHDLLLSFVHTLVVVGLTFLILNRRNLLQRVSLSLLAITVAEIVVANAPLVGTAPSDLWRERPILAEVLERDRLERGEESVQFTVRRSVESQTVDPEGWQATSSPLRLEELAAADRHLLKTNHCLAGPIDSLDSLTTQRLADFTYFYKPFRNGDDAIGGNYWVTSENVERIDSENGPSPWEPLDDATLLQSTKCRVFRHQQPMPRAWIVVRLTVLPELKNRNPDTLIQRGLEVLEKVVDGHVDRRDLRQEAVVESDLEVILPDNAMASSANKRCRLLHDEPNRVVIDVNLQTPGLLVLKDLWFPGWTASSVSLDDPAGDIARHPLRILRTNRIFRGVVLAPGKQRITFEYVPVRLYIGAIISSVGWLALAVYGLACLHRSSN